MISTKYVWTITLDKGRAIPGLNGQKIQSVSFPEIPLSEQISIMEYFEGLKSKVESLKKLQTQTAAELDDLLPSILDKTFLGQL